ncbi:MAG: SDR family oxidoreductase [Tannerella sp.]|jgi:NAD(P)-dependent dehydrogenase (short-subunit alcohol dehydrogenase family)|nr:SDR family oxidoreductase [Tannerella sp.]
MNYNPFSLENKTILVTGASSGIGCAIAVECSKMGATMVITARNSERLQDTYQQMQGSGHRQIIADLNNEEDLKRLAGDAPEFHGIVHNAGITKTLPFKFINRKDFDVLMQTNFYAPVFITQYLQKQKKIRRESSVVFISSIAAFSVGIGDSMYSATKGAIGSLSKALALELSKQQIRVNCIQPGIVRSNIFEAGVISEEQLKETERKYPLGRFGNPEDIAYAAIYLLSDASCWMTGSNLVIDGGFTLQ